MRTNVLDRLFFSLYDNCIEKNKCSYFGGEMQSTDFHQLKDRMTQEKGRIFLFVRGTGTGMKAQAEVSVCGEDITFYYGNGQKLTIEPGPVLDLKYERIDFSLEIWKFHYGNLKVGLQYFA